MSNYLFSRMPLGSIVVFRYNDPKKMGFNEPKTILVLTSNFNGNLHGIKLTGLTPAEQEYLQRLFQAAYQNAGNIFEPLEAQIQQRKKELDILNTQRNELLRNGQRVVVTPAPPQMQFMDRAKKLLGSVIGRVSTFGRTQTTTQQASQVNTNIQQQTQKHDQLIAQKKLELDSFVQNLNKHKQEIQSLPAISTEPYQFYHMFFKSFIGNPARMKNIYRKYNVSRISTPRILKSVGIIPNGR